MRNTGVGSAEHWCSRRSASWSSRFGGGPLARRGLPPRVAHHGRVGPEARHLVEAILAPGAQAKPSQGRAQDLLPEGGVAPDALPDALKCLSHAQASQPDATAAVGRNIRSSGPGGGSGEHWRAGGRQRIRVERGVGVEPRARSLVASRAGVEAGRRSSAPRQKCTVRARAEGAAAGSSPWAFGRPGASRAAGTVLERGF